MWIDKINKKAWKSETLSSYNFTFDSVHSKTSALWCLPAFDEIRRVWSDLCSNHQI